MILVAVLVLLGYASRAAGGKPPKDAAYQYSTAAGGLVQYAIILVVVLAITRPEWWLLALRRPRAWRRTLAAVVIVFVAVYAASAIVSAFGDPGREQGLTPTSWDSSRGRPVRGQLRRLRRGRPVRRGADIPRAGLLAARAARDGSPPSSGSASAFGLAHGLLEGLPILIVFGCGLAWSARAHGQRLPGDGRPRDLQRDRADRRGST